MKNILWCPIDLPKCPVIPQLATQTQWYFWEFAKLTINHSNPYDVTDFTDEIKNEYPDLVEWFKLFPYTNIRNIKMNHQVAEVRKHIDFTKPDLDLNLYKNNADNEPCGYGVLLKGSRKNKLYVLHGNERIYCNMPEDTDVYVLNSTSGWHGVDHDDDRWLFYLHFEIDAQKHKELLEKSLQKYSDYAIIR